MTESEKVSLLEKAKSIIPDRRGHHNLTPDVLELLDAVADGKVSHKSASMALSKDDKYDSSVLARLFLKAILTGQRSFK
jgi:hypothetical protein